MYIVCTITYVYAFPSHNDSQTKFTILLGQDGAGEPSNALDGIRERSTHSADVTTDIVSTEPPEVRVNTD